MEEYPNLTNNTHYQRIYHVPEGNSKLSIKYATKAFQRICPMGFVVENVRPLPSSNKPYCRWYAEFRTVNHVPLAEPEEELKAFSKKLMRYKPLNSKFVTRHPASVFAIAIIYSRDPCPCKEALVFDEGTSTPKMCPTVIKSSNESVLDVSSLFKVW